ncbi:hypothetical protein [Mycolicibacterium septicum]|uniref:hypothetical protein n=1 Tax=Mycolicibacterium septicum TaxID=98668 RepID=UPI001AF28372|nr:hypothetical protein [Mycolicibacterium septicum]QRY51819.1 hypothetical protein JVX95_31345 [Mycolicibacterium septicum]
MTGFSPKTRQLINERADFVCELCGAAPVEQHHHRRARGSGGSKDPMTNTPANAFAICAADHARIESYRTEALDKGWLVRQGKNPSEIPILYRGRYALLSVDGSIEYL